MEELQLSLTPARIDQRNHGIMLSNWRVGQVISALVGDRMPNGSILLTVGGAGFVTSRDIPAQPGSRIQFEVQQVEPKLILKLTGPAVPMSADKGHETMLTGAPSLTQRTQHHSLAQIFNYLSNAESTVSTTPLLYRRDIASLLMANILMSNNLSESAVRRAVNFSGLFTEAHLRFHRSDVATKSTKTLLLLLRNSIISALNLTMLESSTRKSLTQFLGITDSVLASIVRQQLASIPHDPEQTKWVTTLPLQWGDGFLAVNTEVRRRPSQTGEDEDEWQFKMSFELPRLGFITVDMHMIHRRLKIALLLDAEAPAQATKSIETLRSKLVASGFDVDLAVTQRSERFESEAYMMQGRDVDVSI